MRTVFTAVIAVAVVSSGCATTQAASGGATVEPSPVVAHFNTRQIRQAEVDTKAADELQKLEEQIYDLRAETAERIALETLVADAAKKEGLSDDAWLEKELKKATVEVTEEQMRTLFEHAKNKLPEGISYDDVKPQLRQAVEQQGKAKRAREIFATLKKAAGYELVLQPPKRERKVVDATGPSLGDPKAPVTIVEFADFQCPYCAQALDTVHAVLTAYPGQVRVVFRHFPLSFHPKAPKAAEAAVCADEQGKFWQFHDALFESQELEIDAMKAQAARVGLDAKKFADCLDSGRAAAVVKRDQSVGAAAGVTGTPAFFINGIQLSGAQPEETFRKLIDQELSSKK